MSSALERQLLVITGKGGVGKSTVAAAVGLLAAQGGRRTIVAEVGRQSRLCDLLGVAPGPPGAEREVSERLSSISIDSDQALLEWLQKLGGRVSGRLLASSGTFQYFAAAAPGARELVTMVKVWELTQTRRWRGRLGYDLVVLDAPATGHALGMLRAPHTFGAIARVGPIASQCEAVAALLEDEARCCYVAVAHATAMAVTETLELERELQRLLGRQLQTVVVNGVLPQRFSAAELRLIEERRSDDLTRRAAAAAREVHTRARFQHSQVARLRRRRLAVVAVPFQFVAELDLTAVERIAGQLAARL